MNLIHDIPSKTKDGYYNMIVENPRGVSCKFEIDKEYGIIGLDRLLKVPMGFPFEYGFIPGTWNESDNDPVDIMVLIGGGTFVGCLMHVKVIGMYRLIDTGEVDNKVLAVCDGDEMFTGVDDLKDISTHFMKKIEFFWTNYKTLTPRKDTKGLGWSSKASAEKYIQSAMQYYEEKFHKSPKK